MLGELIGYDFEGMGLDRLYQVSDLLWKHHDELEAHCYQQELSLFQMDETITLFDLTNTFFEGAAKDNETAQRGRSKEKRTDCPLVTCAEPHQKIIYHTLGMPVQPGSV